MFEKIMDAIMDAILMICFAALILCSSIGILAIAISILDLEDIVRPIVEQLLK